MFWTETVTNEELLKRTNNDQEITKHKTQRKLK